jgi:hypothetical protein
MDWDVIPAAVHIQTIVEGALRAGSNVVLSISRTQLKKMGIDAPQLIEYYRNFSQALENASLELHNAVDIDENDSADVKRAKRAAKLQAESKAELVKNKKHAGNDDTVKVVHPDEVSSRFILNTGVPISVMFTVGTSLNLSDYIFPEYVAYLMGFPVTIPVPIVLKCCANFHCTLLDCRKQQEHFRSNLRRCTNDYGSDKLTGT